MRNKNRSKSKNRLKVRYYEKGSSDGIEYVNQSINQMILVD